MPSLDSSENVKSLSSFYFKYTKEILKNTKDLRHYKNYSKARACIPEVHTVLLTPILAYGLTSI